MVKEITEVFCTLQIEGIHNWPNCPFDEVAYLRDPHRHIFYIKAYAPVFHDDRDIEFIMMKHKIHNYIKSRYFNVELQCCKFGAMSCEMIAQELLYQFDLTRCEVSEDNENGAVVTKTEPHKEVEHHDTNE